MSKVMVLDMKNEVGIAVTALNPGHSRRMNLHIAIIVNRGIIYLIRYFRSLYY